MKPVQSDNAEEELSLLVGSVGFLLIILKKDTWEISNIHIQENYFWTKVPICGACFSLRSNGKICFGHKYYIWSHRKKKAAPVA